jgi:DsbC/DsbD-like thiol-disulfide interchange protein/cytochrome c biogenesis protein CcdA
MYRVLALLLFLIAAAPASAQFDRLNQPLAPARGNAITPELIVNGRAIPGGSAELAIFMRVKPGWHGYWLNPGDAGLPMSVEWQLPKGWSVGPLRYPVPHRLLVSGIVNYVYEDDYAVLTALKVPRGTTGMHRIAAKMRWLACTDKICVPEDGEAEVEVSTGGMVASDARFNAWRQALPQPLSTTAAFQSTGKIYRIAIPLPRSVAVKDPYVFPIDDDVVNYAAAQEFFRDGDRLVAHVGAGDGDPKVLRGVLALGDGRGLEFEAHRRPVGSSGTPLGAPQGAALLWALLGALAGGILLNLMPCVFPILAMKALHLARAGGDERAARREAVGYAAGAVIGTAALGGALLLLRAGGSAAGWAFQLQDPRTILVLLLLAAAITLNLLRLFELPVLGGEATPAGSVGTGALAAFVATPCSGPFMGAALGAALLMPWWGSVAVFAALGLGLALPFGAVAFVPALRRKLPRPGPWMARFQRFLAVPMAATVVAALWLLYRQTGAAGLLAGVGALALLALILFLVGSVQRKGGNTWPIALAGTVGAIALGLALLPSARGFEAQIPAGAERWSNDAVREAQAAGRPVFVYFTADWCLTCKANEAGAIARSETQSAFKEGNVAVLVGDWTNGDPAIGRFLESRGRAGVPLYLWYAPGKAEPEELPQILTPSMLIERARTGSQGTK